ncbi:cyclopropane fatty acyl phospholipid synthase [Candidatus Uhrbacteria bacterium]|jgi:cyclopropane-fatty-acyl-phospholipid synthase|nr:cyclopropane fatty acyl phospholipid synthase [Candidatus Uhrbacteria bacterium]
MNAKDRISSLLEQTGIEVNGPNPWDPQVHDERFYKRVLAQGSMGLGESYMDGWWDCDAIDEMINRILRANLREKLGWNVPIMLEAARAHLTNKQKGRKSFKVGEQHYDAGNDLYKAMLDDRMVYTGAYFKDTDDLNQAQENKLDLVCRKLGLKKGDKVLDIGCGWASFAKFAAEKYGANVVGVTVSKEQVALGNKLCEGLPVEIRLQDYRDVNEKFDHVMSLGMVEHVGAKNLREYFKTAHRVLKDDGLFVLQSIGSLTSAQTNDPWLEKYIFPNSMLPSVKQFAVASEGLFVMEDWQNMGKHYEHTLLAWHKNFNEHWHEFKDQYDDRFFRMWNYYLLICAGLFRARKGQLWQIVYSKNGVKNGYEAPR